MEPLPPMATTKPQPSLRPPFRKSIYPTTSAPVLYQDKQYICHKSRDKNGSLEAFLRHDLDVSRLTDVEPFLWLAGMSKAARPLHHQAMMNRDIVVTEQADPHLTWQGSRIYIKPLPNYLLNFDFWNSNICSCDGSLFEDAKGFLLSYVWLVPSESDFQMAMDNSSHPRLLPHGLTYRQWNDFITDLLEEIDLSDIKQINPRYRFGEIRLSRLNSIYRLTWTKFGTKHIIRGYFYGYYEYTTFIETNFTWMITVFGYIVIVLTAMQVGLATNRLVASKKFQDASYGFTVFSIVSILVAIVLMMLMMLVLTIDNFAVAAIHERQTKKPEKMSM